MSQEKIDLFFYEWELKIIDMGTNNTDPIGKAVNQGSASFNPI